VKIFLLDELQNGVKPRVEVGTIRGTFMDNEHNGLRLLPSTGVHSKVSLLRI